MSLSRAEARVARMFLAQVRDEAAMAREVIDRLFVALDEPDRMEGIIRGTIAWLADTAGLPAQRTARRR